MNDLPVPDDVLEDWLGGPVPERQRKYYEIFDYLLLQE
jgi:hypothetical protein